MLKSFKTPTWIAAVAAALMGLSADPGWAQAVRSGTTNPALAGNPSLRGNATAYDSINKVYLVVAANGFVYGRFVNADGVPISSPNGTIQFGIQVSAANYGAFPRVTFSPDADNGAGAFLVTWTESDAVNLIPWVHARLVSFTRNGAFGDDSIVGSNLGLPAAYGNGEQGNAVAYSSTSKLFIVVYTRLTYANLTAYRLGLNAQAIDQVAIPAKGAGEGERDPSVAYDPDDNQFLITYAGYGQAGPLGAFVRARRIDAATGAVLDQIPIPVYASTGTYITDTAYDTRSKSYLSAWSLPPPFAVSLGRIVKPDGTMPGGVTVLSTRWYAYDALSVAFNALTGTYFMVSHNSNPIDGHDDGGVEIKSDGNPVDNGFVVTSTPLPSTGNFYPRISASTDQPRWLMSSAYNFATGMVQLLAGTAVGPPPLVSAPKMGVDQPLNNANLPAGRFTVSGWAIDKGAPSGTGVDAVYVWAFPASGASATLLGTAAYGMPRPDVVSAAAVDPRFTNCGFAFDVSGLWLGAYDIVVYSHSTVDGAMLSSGPIRVNVSGYMAIDTPRLLASVGTYFRLSGWAFDGSDPSALGSGIDWIYAYAYPQPGSGLPPIPIGSAQLHLSRPDVAAAFGSRFNDAGFALLVWGLEYPKTYNIVVFAHSIRTGTWVDWRAVRVQVTTQVVVDQPAPPPPGGPPTPVSPFFTISGWAIDTASVSGTGVDEVHVYAYPNPGSSTPPIYLGKAGYSVPRQDVINSNPGLDPRFLNCGYILSIPGWLAPGTTYDLVVFVHSTVDGTFRGAKVVRVTIQ